MARNIIIAVTEGRGSDPESNFKLRLAIEKAKAVNMPKENIQRAIDRATNRGKDLEISEVIYEAFAPMGVGMLIKCATDNRQRSVAEIKNVLERGGGALAESGAVSHFFSQVGLIDIDKGKQNSEKILDITAESGAIDIEEQGDRIIVYTKPFDLHKITEFIKQRGLTIKSSELIYKPITAIPIENRGDYEKIDNLIRALEEREDVIAVYSNQARGT